MSTVMNEVQVQMSYSLPEMNTVKSHMLNDKWTFYNHLPSEKDWTMSGYTVLCKDMDTVEHVLKLRESLPEKMIKYSMLFMMRSHITPLWEDKQNRNGGCFSYKVSNKNVYKVWKDLTYVVVGSSISKNVNFVNCVTGITISPKKNFCIIKIWMSSCEYQNPKIITTDIVNLSSHGSLFKKHVPEY